MTANLTPSTRKITRMFREADDDQRARGLDWYARARRLAEELDPADPERAAAVIAVLSPQLSWPRNVKMARLAYSAHAEGATTDEIVPALRGCLPANAHKAAAILWGADPLGVVSGPKVSAFWHVIAHPDDPRAVVVDRHAYDIAVGRVTDDRTRGRALGRKGGYSEVADCYLRAARALSRTLGHKLTTSDVQAVTWTVWREGHAAANHGDAA